MFSFTVMDSLGVMFIVILIVLVIASLIILAVYLVSQGLRRHGQRREVRLPPSRIVVKGKAGEAIVKEALNKEAGFLFSNYLIKDRDGVLHEIDHIFVAKTGIYVIETKNISGRVTGGDDDKYWTVHNDFHNTAHQILNPVRQNKTHVRKLKEMLPPQFKKYLVSLVVFVQNNIDDIKSDDVIGLNELSGVIRGAENVLGTYELLQINNFLKMKIDPTLTHEALIKQINERYPDA